MLDPRYVKQLRARARELGLRLQDLIRASLYAMTPSHFDLTFSAKMLRKLKQMRKSEE
jgi:hypothetical protein